MKLSLLVADGVHAGEVISIAGVSLLVGRGPQCHVRPNSPAIGPRHCMLLVRGGRVFLRDLGSKTGTFLNDRQLRGEIELQDGDMVRIGPLTFIVQVESQDANGAPAASFATSQATAEQPLSMLDETVDLTRLEEADDSPSAADTQVVPDLEPYPEPEDLASWHAAEEEYVAPLLPSVAAPHQNGAAARVPSNETARLVTSRARLPRISRSPRRPPT